MKDVITIRLLIEPSNRYYVLCIVEVYIVAFFLDLSNCLLQMGNKGSQKKKKKSKQWGFGSLVVFVVLGSI